MNKQPALLMLLIILALTGSVVGCGTDNSVTPTPMSTPTISTTPAQTPTPTPPAILEANYTTYIDAQNGFSITYPEEWQIRTTTHDVFAVQASESCDGKNIICYLQKLRLPVETDTETYFSQILCDTFTSKDRYFIYGEKLGVSGRSAIKWVTSHENIEGLPTQEMVFYIYDVDKAWILSFTTAFTCWEEYEDIFQRMLDSFLII